MTLYNHPPIYAALFAPDREMWDGVTGWLARYLDRPAASILDPACGPGNWLLPFAEQGLRVLGNDLNPAMSTFARRRLSPFDAQISRGDMQDLPFAARPNFTPVDAAINLDASVGHLADDDGVIQHLRSVHAHVRDGGLYLLGITLLDMPERDDTPDELFESGEVWVDGGTAQVRYASLWRDPALRRERVGLTLTTRGIPGCPPTLTEAYDLLTFAPADVERCLAHAGGWDLLAAHDMTVDDFPDRGFQPGCRGVTLVLKKG